MADVMVTGRMSKAKKDAGNKVLESLGTNASTAINQLYDHLIHTNTLPFEEEAHKPITQHQIKEAMSFLDSIPITNNFSTMSEHEITAHRLDALLSE